MKGFKVASLHLIPLSQALLGTIDFTAEVGEITFLTAGLTPP